MLLCTFGVCIKPARAQSLSTATTTAPTAATIERTAPTALTHVRQSPLSIPAGVYGHEDRKSVPVPPTLEIEVLDPNVDPLGNPAVLTKKTPHGLEVDIPPVVLVHRYYYTGDRSFQGPMLPGGPSILVMNHPGTGVRQYLEVQMLPGAPRVTYTRHAVTYDYGPQAITVYFGLHCKPKVTYVEGVPIGEHLRRTREEMHRNLDDLARRSGLTEASKQVHDGVKNAADNAVELTHNVAKRIASPVVQLVRATPLGSVFAANPERQAERARDASVQRAGADARALAADIKTVR
jgi:hypothetical protein